MKNKPHKLWVLFLTTLYISAFTFGGGFVIVTFMKHKFVDELHWIDEQEMLDFTALAQSCPGAIAVNAAILVGWNVYGFAGMIVATLGTILPPMIILSVVSFFLRYFFNKCMGSCRVKRNAGRSCCRHFRCCVQPWRKCIKRKKQPVYFYHDRCFCM